MKVVILFNKVLPEASEDELDVLVQVEQVSKSLTNLGYLPVPVPISLNLSDVMNTLIDLRPAIIFNLVESIAGVGRFIHFAPTLLEHLKLRYTGASADTLYLTTNKIVTKERLQSSGIFTPPWIRGKDLMKQEINFDPPFIIKPVSEDASVGLDETAVVYEKNLLPTVLDERIARYGDCFVESYVHGREFNISMLAGEHCPEVLPPAEMLFKDYPEDKPWVVGYNAKWDSKSFEYNHTVRSFQFPAHDHDLLIQLADISLKCWTLFSFRGYARVDFRIDRNGNIYVLEVNANPCLSPDSGFIAASEYASLKFDTLVERIIKDSHQ